MTSMTQDEFRKMKSPMKAKGRRKPGEMTGVEKRMNAELDADHKAGRIEWFAYEPLKFRLADRTYYSPDFAVMHTDGTIEFREVKGSWKAPHQDDSRVKIKVAAEQFPMFLFTAYESRKGEWKIERFNA